MGLHFAGNKNTFYVFLLYTYKALNYFILFIHINLCLWQHFLHGFIITGPVWFRNKIMCFQIRKAEKMVTIQTGSKEKRMEKE